MGEKQSRCVGPRCDEKDDRARGLRGIRLTFMRVSRLGVVLLGVVTVLGQGPLRGRVGAQETPAKDEARTKTETPRDAVRVEPGQEPAPVAAEALSLRYRFIEKYGTAEAPENPDLITQYRVGIIETQKTEREKAQGAPDRAEISRRTIYTERAAQVAKGELVSAVRRYDRFAIKDATTTVRPAKTPLFEGLTILLRRQSGQKPKILSLTEGRPLREFEFAEITKQVIVPQLTALFPPAPKRVGDSWPISRAVAQCLVGEVPEADEYVLTGTLVEVRKAASGPSLTAVIGVSGQMNLSLGLSSLSAQLHFVFDPAPVAAATTASTASTKGVEDGVSKPREPRDKGVVEARGKITRVLMVWAVSNALPEGEGARLKQTVTYELNLERKFTQAAAEGAGGQNAALVVPDPIPAPTNVNSWVVHDDAQGRFHFLHPQTLVLSEITMGTRMLHFVDQNAGTGKDVFILELPPGKEDPQADRRFRDSQDYQREIDADWAKGKLETVRGASGWLPEAEWAPWKVYRNELGVKTAGADDGTSAVQRIFFDYYLVLSNRNDCFRVQSMTVRNDHVAFRTQAEAMIKSFRSGPWDGKAKATAAAPTPPR
jgi:hypothetical protein